MHTLSRLFDDTDGDGSDLDNMRLSGRLCSTVRGNPT